MTNLPTDPSHFEQMYATDPDPWHFASSDYERDKYAATLAALPPRRFVRGLEVGCSIGVLTRQLATRCDTMLGLDVVQVAIDQATSRCADQPNMAFSRMAVPDEWPPGQFDLIVFSEVLYYLGATGLAQTAEASVASMMPGGLIVLVNWLGDTGASATGDEAAGAFISKTGWLHQSKHRAAQYRIDVLAAS